MTREELRYTITKKKSVSYAAESIILAEHFQNHFAKVSFAKRQKIVSQQKIT